MPDHFYGDPFLLKTDNDKLHILFEDFAIDDNYANISLMTLDEDLGKLRKKLFWTQKVICLTRFSLRKTIIFMFFLKQHTVADYHAMNTIL